MRSKLQFNTRTDVYTLIQLYEEITLIWMILAVAMLNGAYNLVLERDFVGAGILILIAIASLLKCWLANYKKRIYVDQGKFMAEQNMREQREAREKEEKLSQ